MLCCSSVHACVCVCSTRLTHLFVYVFLCVCVCVCTANLIKTVNSTQNTLPGKTVAVTVPAAVALALQAQSPSTTATASTVQTFQITTRPTVEVALGAVAIASAGAVADVYSLLAYHIRTNSSCVSRLCDTASH